MDIKYFVKILNNNQVALFYDEDLTLPANINFSETFSDGLIVAKLQDPSISIPSREFPRRWDAVDWPVSWINSISESTSTLVWTNSGSTITWKNTL